MRATLAFNGLKLYEIVYAKIRNHYCNHHYYSKLTLILGVNANKF